MKKQTYFIKFEADIGNVEINVKAHNQADAIITAKKLFEGYKLKLIEIKEAIEN